MKKKDIIVIVSILLVALFAFLAVELTKEAGSEVIVKVDGVEVDGGTNILCIKNKEAYLIDAKCPDHLCVKQGKISKNGETITCLPYKLTVTVTGGENPEVDLVS